MRRAMGRVRWVSWCGVALLVLASSACGRGEREVAPPSWPGSSGQYVPNGSYGPGGAYNAPNAGSPYQQPTYAPVAPAPALPTYVRLTLLNATLGPAKYDRRPWDGPGGSVSPKVMEKLASALSSINPYAAVASVMGLVAVDSLAKPDPLGDADLFDGATPRERYRLSRRDQRDTFTPSWDGPPTWANVRLAPTTRLRVHILDRDQFHDDEVGTAEIGYGDLVEALQSGHVHQVRVSEQTQRQVLFLGISVMAE